MRRKLNGSHAKHPDGRGPVCGHMEPGDRLVSGLRVDCPACLAHADSEASSTTSPFVPIHVLEIIDRWTNGRGVRRCSWKLSATPSRAWASLFQERMGGPIFSGPSQREMSDLIVPATMVFGLSDVITVPTTLAEESNVQERLRACAEQVNATLVAWTKGQLQAVADMDGELAEC